MSKKVQEETQRDARVRAALVSWDTLNEVVGEMNEDDVLHAMHVEKMGAARQSFIKRLTQRLNGIRVAEVKKEIDKISEGGA